MHYKCGTAAQVGDVVAFPEYNQQEGLGVVLSISPGSTTCNANVARFLTSGQGPGGFVLLSRQGESSCVTLGACELVKRFGKPAAAA